MQTIYDNLLSIQKTNSKVDVGLDKNQVFITSNADGQRKVRIIIVLALSLFALTLLGLVVGSVQGKNNNNPIPGFLFIFAWIAGLIYFYITKRFVKEKLMITKDELIKVDKKNRTQVISRQSIIGIDHMQSKNAVVVLTNTGPVLIFKNSETAVLQQVGYILRELWLKRN